MTHRFSQTVGKAKLTHNKYKSNFFFILKITFCFMSAINDVPEEFLYNRLIWRVLARLPKISDFYKKNTN